MGKSAEVLSSEEIGPLEKLALAIKYFADENKLKRAVSFDYNQYMNLFYKVNITSEQMKMIEKDYSGYKREYLSSCQDCKVYKEVGKYWVQLITEVAEQASVNKEFADFVVRLFNVDQ